ncbi:LysR family transcriptional regulator [Erysipelotrichaceae bacterium RD49]|nr:LysR family transcriptional regulator [Erysipelotrichaceae bacterium RD49]
MTLNQIEYFVEIANAGSYAKAAQLIHISQPSLSTAIHNLEKELDVQLFESRRKQIILTDAGRIFLGSLKNPVGFGILDCRIV